jgi:hypothetical protein
MAGVEYEVLSLPMNQNLDKEHVRSLELNPIEESIILGHFAGELTFFKLLY